ncbi:MAG TPA: hypothetical protein VGL36_35740 [Kribbella sp.]
MSPRKPAALPQGPFPYLDTLEWRERFIQAGRADERCNLPDAALRRFSLEVLDIKSLLKTRGRGPNMEIFGFRDEAVEEIETSPYGTLFQLRVPKQPGLGGAINEFNVRHAFEVAADPTVVPGRVRSLDTAAGAPLAMLEAQFDSWEALTAHLDFVTKRLVSAEQTRPYDLKADLEATGQSEAAVYHALHYIVGDDQWVVPAATAGSNRTKNRAELFGLSAAAGIIGLNQSVLGGVSGKRWTDPVHWRDAYTAKLNAGWYYEPDDDDPDSDMALWHDRANAAYNIATVPARLVIGYRPASATKRNFDAALSATNLRTHLRGPLDFSAENQAMSNGRSLVDEWYAEGDLTDLEYGVLTGQRPAAELAATPREAVVELVRLVDRIAYPQEAEIEARKRIRRILVEPFPSQLGVKHARTREQMRVALLTQAIGGVDLQESAMDTPPRKQLRQGVDDLAIPLDLLIKTATSDSLPGWKDARDCLGHLAVPGLVNGRVLLGPHGSTGDRRTPAKKLAALKSNLHGVNLLIEGIDALADVIAIRAGLAPSRPAWIDPGRVRRVGTSDETPASAAWLHENWPTVDDPGDSGDSSVDVDATDEEKWAALYGALPGMVKSSNEKIKGLLDHVTEMATYVADGRGLLAAERAELWEEIANIGETSDAAVKIVRKLKAPEPGDLQYGASEGGQ